MLGIIDKILWFIGTVLEQIHRVYRMFFPKRSGLNISLSYLQKMGAYKFEEFMTEMFRRDGFKAKTTKKSGDGGIDILLFRDGKKYLVQCKRYSDKNKVTAKDVRELNGVVNFEGATGAIFVTTSDYTANARAYERKNLILINGKALERWVQTGIPPF